MCRVEHSHVPELRGQESSRAVDEGMQHLCCYRDCGGCCVLRLWPKQRLVQQIPACSTLKSPDTEHPCGLSCEPLLLCFQLHQPGFYSPIPEPLTMPELLLTQRASGVRHLRGGSLFHLSWWSTWSQHSQTHHVDSQGQALPWEHLSLFQQDCHCGELCGMGMSCGGVGRCSASGSPSQLSPCPGAAGYVLPLAVCSIDCCLSPSGKKLTVN